MIEFESINHSIQQSIVQALSRQKVMRFRDLQLARTNTNLFSYHLTSLVKANYIKKVNEGYTLTRQGLSYVDSVSVEKESVRSQPKIIVMLLIQNSEGDVLLQKRTKQPYIDTWTLPYGKVQIEDRTVGEAAFHVAQERLAMIPEKLKQAGICYIRVDHNEQIASSTLAHIFRFNNDKIILSDKLIWVQPHKLSQYELAPAVESIVARSFFGDAFFFEEFEESD